MSNAFKTAEKVIRWEYERLCNVLKLFPVPLEIYVCDADSTKETLLGIPEKNCDPLYSGTRKLMVLPLASAKDQWPTESPLFPPCSLLKFSDEWPAWRIELWHEVVHQVSNDILNSWSPKEPGRARLGTAPSQLGHGAGWWAAIQCAAKKLSVDPSELDKLLDQ